MLQGTRNLLPGYLGDEVEQLSRTDCTRRTIHSGNQPTVQASDLPEHLWR